MRELTCLTVLLIVSGVASAAAERADATESAPEQVVLQVKDFVHDQRTVGDGPWRIEKFQGADGLWRARLSVEGVVRGEYEGCGEREDWMRFLVWPDSVPAERRRNLPRMLFVLRYEGGANGRECLDIVDLDNGCRPLFATTSAFNFRRMEHLDEDGRPEVIGSSRRFEGILGFSSNDSPYPLVVLGYDSSAKRYVCRTDDFPKDSEEAIARFETAFELNRSVDRKVPYAPDDASVHERQFAPLVRWAVELCFLGRPDEAWALFDTYCTTEAARTARDAIESVLADERYFKEVSGEGADPE